MVDMKNTAKKFNTECPRCDGHGTYDRGTCFECKGRRFVKRTRKPSAPARNLCVTYNTGKQDFVTMYFFTREYAIKAVEYQMIARGWVGTITEVQ